LTEEQIGCFIINELSREKFVQNVFDFEADPIVNVNSLVDSDSSCLGG